MKKFDYIISLGQNCEPSFQFLTYFGFLESFPFSWCYVNDFHKQLELLEGKISLFTGEYKEYPETNMWQCLTTDITFHAQRKAKDFKIFSKEQLIVEKEKEFSELKSKLNHLFKKLDDVHKSNKSQLYIVTIHNDNINAIKNYTHNLQRILNTKTSNFDILVVLENNNINLKDESHIFYRFINNFSPSNDVTNLLKCDTIGWAKIFQEFAPQDIKKQMKRFKFDNNENGKFTIITSYLYNFIKYKSYYLLFLISSKKSEKLHNRMLKYKFITNSLRRIL